MVCVLVMVCLSGADPQKGSAALRVLSGAHQTITHLPAHMHPDGGEATKKWSVRQVLQKDPLLFFVIPTLMEFAPSLSLNHYLSLSITLLLDWVFELVNPSYHIKIFFTTTWDDLHVGIQVASGDSTAIVQCFSMEPRYKRNTSETLDGALPRTTFLSPLVSIHHR